MSGEDRRRTIAAEAVSAVTLIGLTVLLYRKALGLWWTYDDPNILRIRFDYHFIDTFINGRVWPQQLFTPLLYIAFDAEWKLFGFDPARWYAMQIAIACVTTLLVYAAVRQFLDWKRSLVAAAIFAAGPPLCSVVTQLSTVHYFLAISFCALAVIGYAVALRGAGRSAGVSPAGRAPSRRPGANANGGGDAGVPSGRLQLADMPGGGRVSGVGDRTPTFNSDSRPPTSATRVLPFLILSVVSYLLAMLAKEVAIPLPLLLLALPLRDARTRIRFLIGHGVAVVVYFLWRYSVLGTFLGAYGWQIDAKEWPHLLLLLPWRIAQGATGAGVAIGFALVGLMTLTIILGIRNRGALLLLIAALLVVGGPMLPLAKEVNRRYVVVPWLAWSIAFAAATTRRNRRVAATLLIAAPLLAVAANRLEWRHEFPLRRQMSDEARVFFYDMGAEGLLRRPLTPPSTMGEVKWLKTIHFGKPAGEWFYDDIFLCSGGAAGKHVYEYEKTMIVDITADIARIAAKHCHSIRGDVPLSATFHYRRPALYWDLGPYADGRYSAVIGNGIQAFEIPRRDALNVPGTTSLALRIRYDSPSGWTTYSPELTLDFVHPTEVNWRR